MVTPCRASLIELVLRLMAVHHQLRVLRRDRLLHGGGGAAGGVVVQDIAQFVVVVDLEEILLFSPVVEELIAS